MIEKHDMKFQGNQRKNYFSSILNEYMDLEQRLEFPLNAYRVKRIHSQV